MPAHETRWAYRWAFERFLFVTWSFAALALLFGFNTASAMIPGSAMASAWLVCGIGVFSARLKCCLAGLTMLWASHAIYRFMRDEEVFVSVSANAGYFLGLALFLHFAKRYGWVEISGDKSLNGSWPQWNILSILLAMSWVALFLALPRMTWTLKEYFWSIQAPLGENNPGVIEILVTSMLFGPPLVLAVQAGELVPKSRTELVARINSIDRNSRRQRWLPRGVLMAALLWCPAMLILPGYHPGPTPISLIVVPPRNWLFATLPIWLNQLMGFGLVATCMTAIKFSWNTRLITTPFGYTHALARIIRNPKR